MVKKDAVSSKLFGHSSFDITVVYDGECPFCSNYVRFHRLRRNLGSVGLINAREHLDDVECARKAGLNLDDGMLVFWRDQIYSGGDAIFILTSLGAPGGLFNILNRIIFSNAVVARALYPILRAGRNFALAALGRTRIFPQ